jgi:hypothetical protein
MYAAPFPRSPGVVFQLPSRIYHCHVSYQYPSCPIHSGPLADTQRSPSGTVVCRRAELAMRLSSHVPSQYDPVYDVLHGRIALHRTRPAHA